MWVQYTTFWCINVYASFIHKFFLWIAAVEKVDSAEVPDIQGMDNEEEAEETPTDKYYDKAKCFFDNISSDLKPRWWCNLYNFLTLPKEFGMRCNICNFLNTFVLGSSGEPRGQRRRSWTWKHLEFPAASWEAEDSEAEGTEGRVPLSSDPSQKLVVGGCEGFSLTFC